MILFYMYTLYDKHKHNCLTFIKSVIPDYLPPSSSVQGPFLEAKNREWKKYTICTKVKEVGEGERERARKVINSMKNEGHLTMYLDA